MGACKYCGKSAGFFKSEHKDCRRQYEGAAAAIRRLCADAALHGASLDALPDRIRETAEQAGIPVPDHELRSTLIAGWCASVDEAMEDNELSPDEQNGLNRYRIHFNLGEDELDAGGHFRTFRQLTLLRTLMEEQTIPRFDRRAAHAQFGRLPFNLMKSEELLWIMRDVGYVQQISKREFSGQSMGMSFKVAKGVYLRPSRFKGSSNVTKSMELTDRGMLALTTKHIYYRGREKGFRVRLEKLVSLDPYSDALGIMRDSARATPEAFTMSTMDAWFAANAIEAMQYMDEVTLPKSGAPTLADIVDADVDEDLAGVNDDEDDDDDDDDNGGGMFAGGMSLA